MSCSRSILKRLLKRKVISFSKTYTTQTRFRRISTFHFKFVHWQRRKYLVIKEVTLSGEKAKYFSNFAILSSEAGVWSKPFGKMTQKKRLAGRQQGRRLRFCLFFALVAVICFFAFRKGSGYQIG